ncbi:hypothetical protein ACQP1W_24000 [Spirillospora sp. CA-255316]
MCELLEVPVQSGRRPESLWQTLPPVAAAEVGTTAPPFRIGYARCSTREPDSEGHGPCSSSVVDGRAAGGTGLGAASVTLSHSLVQFVAVGTFHFGPQPGLCRRLFLWEMVQAGRASAQGRRLTRGLADGLPVGRAIRVDHGIDEGAHAGGRGRAIAAAARASASANRPPNAHAGSVYRAVSDGGSAAGPQG